jgi:hypothetical protein
VFLPASLSVLGSGQSEGGMGQCRKVEPNWESIEYPLMQGNEDKKAKCLIALYGRDAAIKHKRWVLTCRRKSKRKKRKEEEEAGEY